MNGETPSLDLGLLLLTFGGLFVAGLAADALGRRTRVPRVTLLLLVGVGAGSAGLDLLPEALREGYDLLATVALTMVAFVLGAALSPQKLRANGRRIVIVSLAVVLASIALIGGGLYALGVAPGVAVALAGLATATDPAATQDVARQSGAEGPFVDTLLGVVAVDDAWGLIAFSLLLVAASVASGGTAGGVLGHALWEVGGALALGAAVGAPAALLSGRLRPGEPMLVEALAAVFLCAGLAMLLETSVLLTGMAAGTVVATVARHHQTPIHEIEEVEQPFLILFFVLAGASLDLDALAGAGWVALAYVALRVAARLLGGWAGGALAGMGPRERRWIGPALLPQAGVAIGMALVAANQFPEQREAILSIAVGTTIAFEIAGPLAAQWAILRVARR